MDGWMESWMDGWMGGCVDRWIHGSIDRVEPKPYLEVPSKVPTPQNKSRLSLTLAPGPLASGGSGHFLAKHFGAGQSAEPVPTLLLGLRVHGQPGETLRLEAASAAYGRTPVISY